MCFSVPSACELLLASCGWPPFNELGGKRLADAYELCFLIVLKSSIFSSICSRFRMKSSFSVFSVKANYSSSILLPEASPEVASLTSRMTLLGFCMPIIGSFVSDYASNGLFESIFGNYFGCNSWTAEIRVSMS